MYSLGLIALWYLLKASLFGSLLRPGTAALWLLDLTVSKALLGSLAGAHLAHGLGAAWVPWLALWLAWCGAQLALGAAPARAPVALAAATWIAVGHPLLMAVLPFHPWGAAAQGWALAAAPALRRAPTLLDLLLPAAA
jgi:hypothetical protein